MTWLLMTHAIKLFLKWYKNKNKNHHLSCNVFILGLKYSVIKTNKFNFKN